MLDWCCVFMAYAQCSLNCMAYTSPNPLKSWKAAARTALCLEQAARVRVFFFRDREVLCAVLNYHPYTFPICDRFQNPSSICENPASLCKRAAGS